MFKHINVSDTISHKLSVRHAFPLPNVKALVRLDYYNNKGVILWQIIKK